MFTLQETCLRVLFRHRDCLGAQLCLHEATQSIINSGDLGDVPIGILWPVLLRCSALQLASIEDATAYGDSTVLLVTTIAQVWRACPANRDMVPVAAAVCSQPRMARRRRCSRRSPAERGGALHVARRQRPPARRGVRRLALALQRQGAGAGSQDDGRAPRGAGHAGRRARCATQGSGDCWWTLSTRHLRPCCWTRCPQRGSGRQSVAPKQLDRRCTPAF